MAHVTEELVGQAYVALASGDRAEIEKYWDKDMVWLVPGHNPLSGWYHGLDAFLAFMGNVGMQSAFSFNMTPVAVMVGEDYSADVTHNVGYRAGYEGSGTVPYTKLDIDVVHVLRWRDGKVIEGRGAIFGNGTNEYDLFWGPLAGHGGGRQEAIPMDPKEVVRAAIENIWNTGNKDLVPQYYGKNFVFHQEEGAGEDGSGVAIGLDNYKLWVEVTHTAFPDIHYNVDAMYAEGEKVAFRYTVTGTHTGDFRGMPPTNKEIKLTGHMIFRVYEGKIITGWGYWDMLGLLIQLGIIPPFGPPGS